ncbi:hypothetical protein BHE74_00022924 [Ensete ventricosum]|nr:hypothetical protein BHE74_00022924 [Ensete ventricosum]RZS06144.1 hypothetical protein BHM03_00036755 [Ensete ventricosum]
MVAAGSPHHGCERTWGTVLCFTSHSSVPVGHSPTGFFLAASGSFPAGCLYVGSFPTGCPSVGSFPVAFAGSFPARCPYAGFFHAGCPSTGLFSTGCSYDKPAQR